MNNKAISVSLAKIDYNLGKPHIYILADCPNGYQFCRFDIIVHMYQAGQWIDKQYDVAGLIASKNDVVLDLPVENLSGVSGPSIYRIILEAIDTTTNDEIEDELFLSDVHGLYRNIVNGLTEDLTCNSVPDDIIKQYLILYAHEAALASGDLDVAKDLFKLAHNAFSKCGHSLQGDFGCMKPTHTTNCGCYGRR